jgi:hypothetical protein
VEPAALHVQVQHPAGGDFMNSEFRPESFGTIVRHRTVGKISSKIFRQKHFVPF